MSRSGIDFNPATVVDALSTGVLVLDPERRLAWMNPAAEALLELSARQAHRAPAAELLWRCPRLVELLDRVVATGEPVVEHDLALHPAATGTVAADVVVTPMADARHPGHLLVELVRVDRYQQITREERLVIQSESARVLLRGLAHEIKNPLGGLRGAAQLLALELRDPELREYTTVIVGEADRLQALVDRMLGPRTPPRKREVNLHEVTERVCALLEAEAGEGLRAERDYDPSIPEIQADPDLLIQAVLNVARNAVEAMGGRGRLVLRTRLHDHPTIGQRRYRRVVRIDVVDDGPGVPPELREHIFYPMVTGRPDGTGLGLSIAQSLVNQHGGLIECTSEPGNTVFSILLPTTCEGAESGP